MARKATELDAPSCLNNVGDIYALTRGVTGTYQGIKFINGSDNGACQEFFLDVDNSDSPVLTEFKGTFATPLTSSKLHINSARFSLNGGDGSVNGQGCSDPSYCPASVNVVGGSSPVQPRVTIILNVSIPGDNQTTGITRTIQTTISQRNLNVHS